MINATGHRNSFANNLRKFTFTPWISMDLMPKAQPLCTGSELNLRDRVLDEGKRIALLLHQAKWNIVGLLVPLQIVCPNPG